MVKTCLPCKRPGFYLRVRKIPWRKQWQPTPVFLPGEFHRQRSLAGYSPWGHKESDTTKRLSLSHVWALFITKLFNLQMYHKYFLLVCYLLAKFSMIFKFLILYNQLSIFSFSVFVFFSEGHNRLFYTMKDFCFVLYFVLVLSYFILYLHI